MHAMSPGTQLFHGIHAGNAQSVHDLATLSGDFRGIYVEHSLRVGAVSPVRLADGGDSCASTQSNRSLRKIGEDRGHASFGVSG